MTPALYNTTHLWEGFARTIKATTPDSFSTVQMLPPPQAIDIVTRYAMTFISGHLLGFFFTRSNLSSCRYPDISEGLATLVEKGRVTVDMALHDILFPPNRGHGAYHQAVFFFFFFFIVDSPKHTSISSSFFPFQNNMMTMTMMMSCLIRSSNSIFCLVLTVFCTIQVQSFFYWLFPKLSTKQYQRDKGSMEWMRPQKVLCFSSDRYLFFFICGIFLEILYWIASNLGERGEKWYYYCIQQTG